jgi:hypothetical protein
VRTGLLKVYSRGKPSSGAELVFGGQRVYGNFEVNFGGKTCSAARRFFGGCELSYVL